MGESRIRSWITPLLPRADPWLDAAFPIAVAVLYAGQRTPAFLILLAWLIWRLCQQISRYPLALVFLLLLGAQAGNIVLERGLQPSSASDPLVIALGFVAMLGRSPQQWQNTLRWLALAIVPIAIWALTQDSALPLDPPVGGINRLGFLLGMLQLAAWAAGCLAAGWWSRLLFWGLAAAVVPMALQNGSRVALLAAPMAIVVSVGLAFWQQRSDWLPGNWGRWMRWRRPVLLGLLLSLGLLSGLLIQRWYLNPPVGSLDGLSDRARLETARCWAAQPLRRGDERLLLGAGYNNDVQKRCDGRRLPVLNAMQPPRPAGLPHAHNLFVQIWAENGLLGLLSLITTLALLARQAWRDCSQVPMQGKRVLVFALPVLLYLLMNGLVSSFQLFLMSNQLLVGLALASLWPDCRRSG